MPVFEEFSFPSSTGENTIRCLKCLPDGAPRGVVQIEHGIAEHMDRYRDFMSFLAENGGMFPGEGDPGMGGRGMQGMGGQAGFRSDGSGAAAPGTDRNEAAVPDADDDEAEEAGSDEPDDDSETGGIDDDIGDESEDNLDDRFDDGLDDRFDDDRKDFRHHGFLMTEETPFETRFFTVNVDAQGAVTAVNTGRIAAVTDTQAAEMVEKAEAKGKTAGYDGNYK